jgi:hypothetical protein
MLKMFGRHSTLFIYETFGVLKLKFGVKTLSNPMQQLYSFQPSSGYGSVGTILCMMNILQGIPGSLTKFII